MSSADNSYVYLDLELHDERLEAAMRRALLHLEERCLLCSKPCKDTLCNDIRIFRYALFRGVSIAKAE